MAQTAERPKTLVPSAPALVVAVTAGEVAGWWRETLKSGPWPDPYRCEQMARLINSRRPADRPIGRTAKKVLSAYNLLIRLYDKEWTDRSLPGEVATCMWILHRDRERLKPAPAMWKQLREFAPLLWLHARSDFNRAAAKPSRRTDSASRTSPPVQFVALVLRRLGYRKATATSVELNLAERRGLRPDRARPSLGPGPVGGPCVRSMKVATRNTVAVRAMA